MRHCALCLLLMSALIIPAAAQTYLLPDPTLTPGAVDPVVSLETICNRTTRERRHVLPATADQVFAAYGVAPTDRGLYELDHLVPLAIAGSNAAANLWPQPNGEAEKKDALEREMQRLACVAYRTLTPAEADKVLRGLQAEIANDWTEAYRRYVGASR